MRPIAFASNRMSLVLAARTFVKTIVIYFPFYPSLDTQGPVVEPCTFSSVFFLTYQWYLEPGELLNLYADRYPFLEMC